MPAALRLVEGLWLLSDHGDWAQVRPLLDFCYFIESDQERTQPAVIKRHMTGVGTYEDAARHYAEVDGRIPIWRSSPGTRPTRLSRHTIELNEPLGILPFPMPAIVNVDARKLTILRKTEKAP